MSSRNFRNMIQVSIGRRSMSPLRPLSLRMMSRHALMMLPSWCAVDFGASVLRAAAVIAMVPSSCRVQKLLKFPDRVPQLIRSTKEISDFNDIPMPGYRRYFQYVRYLELRRPEFDIFLQQFIQHIPRTVRVLVKKCLAAIARGLRSLSSASDRRTISDVAQQVEWICIGLFRRFCEFLERYAFCLQRLDDLGALR